MIVMQSILERERFGKGLYLNNYIPWPLTFENTLGYDNYYIFFSWLYCISVSAANVKKSPAPLKLQFVIHSLRGVDLQLNNKYQAQASWRAVELLLQL